MCVYVCKYVLVRVGVRRCLGVCVYMLECGNVYEGVYVSV